MRLHARVDRNQQEIVDALRRIGCSVQSLAAVGDGCPDLLVGRGGVNFLMEIKDADKKPSARVLTADQRAWHSAWRGWVFVVGRASDALGVVLGHGLPRR